MATLNTNGIFQDANAKYLGSCATYHDLIVIANTAFGANCWSHSITRQDIDYVDFINEKYAVGAVAFVKIETKDGVHHEEMGYGMCNHVDNKGVAILTARKEAAKNAFKEAMQSFGGTILTKVKEVDARDEQMPQGMSLIWTGGNSSGSKLLPSPVLNRSSEKLAESALIVKTAENVTPLKKANNVTEEERRRQERIDRQRQKQEEFRKKLKQNDVQKCDISVSDLTNWDDDYIPGDSFVSMPEEQLSLPLTAAPCETIHANNFSPTGQENRIVINQNRRTPLGIKRNMSLGLGSTVTKQNRL